MSGKCRKDLLITGNSRFYFISLIFLVMWKTTEIRMVQFWCFFSILLSIRTIFVYFIIHCKLPKIPLYRMNWDWTQACFYPSSNINQKWKTCLKILKLWASRHKTCYSLFLTSSTTRLECNNSFAVTAMLFGFG